MRPFVDTNVLVYAHDQDEPAKRDRAVSLLVDIGGQMVISAQVLAEFYVTVTRKLGSPLSPEDAAAQIEELRPAASVATDADLIARAVRVSRDHQLSLWDAMILAAASRGACDVLYSEDLQDGFAFDGIEIRNPFADTGS
ncbi:PIN domain-containing protein [Euzebya tangerina]|uniref:PIN domain-containing protein n=1 Tax=Euzebya tangerina TaxID=591198 RepID=UPI0013C2C54E|nr:PIN domain-containing protein [Euzebya tangerina]